MASGPGGLARGLQAGMQLGLQSRQLRQEREQTRAERLRQLRQEIREQHQKNFERAAEIHEKMVAAGVEPGSERHKQALAPIIRSDVSMFADEGVQELGLGLSATDIANRYATFFQLPSAEETGQVEAEQAGRERRAELQAEREEGADDVAVSIELPDGNTQNVEARRIGNQLHVPDNSGVFRPLSEVFPDATGVTSQGDDQARVSGDDVDVIMNDGSRQPANAIRVGQDRVLVNDGTGRFRPLREVFPNAASVEPARARRETGEIPQDAFTPEQFTQMTDMGGLSDVQTELGVGPVDFLSGVIAGTTGAGQLQEAVFGEDAGLEQRRARRFFEEIENNVLIANRPAEGGRPSNLQLNYAAKRVGSFGALATERGAVEDLRELNDTSQRKLEQAVAVLNDPRFSDETRRDAEQRAIALGNLVQLTDAAIQAAESPEVKVRQTTGKPMDQFVSEASDEEVADTLVTLDDDAAMVLFEQLDDERKRRINELLKAE